MNIERVRGYFNDPRTVEHYVKAVANVGLWESEKMMFERWFERENEILDLGSGTGRIALGLWKLGFGRVTGVDLAEEMVAEAGEIAAYLSADVSFSREDATALSFEDDRFDGCVFGFNGLMQIPGRENRRRALTEIWRTVRSGGVLVFTTLDREDRLYSSVFGDSEDFEHDPVKNPNVLEFGDRHFVTAHGTTFMHVPLRSEVIEDLEMTGWNLAEDCMRSEIAPESGPVEQFSEDCRFWVAKKPMR